MLKICKDCQLEKPIEDFPHWQRKSGYIEISVRCHPCRTIFRKKRYENNKESERNQNRRWHQDNKPWLKEDKREYINKWRRDHKDKRKAEASRRRVYLAGAEGFFTPEEFIELCEYYNNECLACHRNDVPLTIDHIVPVSKNGSNWIDNIQPLCGPCNSSKGAKTIDYRK